MSSTPDIFQSTLLMRGATASRFANCNNNGFQSTLLMRGATLYQYRQGLLAEKFQSTLLMRGATSSICGIRDIGQFQSTLLMRGATAGRSGRGDMRWISIHAPHARSDTLISARSAHIIFQSTLLMRGATLSAA